MSIYNTHNQKGKDKERLRLRGRRPIAGQNSSSKIGFLQRTSAATWGDVTKYHPTTSVEKFDHSPVLTARNINRSHICPALRGLSSRARCGFLYLPVKHGARSDGSDIGGALALVSFHGRPLSYKVLKLKALLTKRRQHFCREN